MPLPLSKPAQGSGIKLADHIGELIVFIGCKLEKDVNTTFGVSNAARVDIAVTLDGDDAGAVFFDSLLFNKTIVPALTQADSDIVVGRLALGAAKAGQNAPYILSEPTDEEVAAVLAWLEENIIEAEGSYALAEAEAESA
jgi:hypothetical protein